MMWFKTASIGERIRWLMETREITQAELGSRIGVSQAAISNIVTESSRKPSAPTLLKLAAELRASPDWIITGDGAPFDSSTIRLPDERQLLDAYRKMTDGHKAAFRALAAEMTKEKA